MYVHSAITCLCAWHQRTWHYGMYTCVHACMYVCTYVHASITCSCSLGYRTCHYCVHVCMYVICMYVCVCICTYTHVHTHIHSHIHVHRNFFSMALQEPFDGCLGTAVSYIHTCTYIYIHIHTYTYIYIQKHLFNGTTKAFRRMPGYCGFLPSSERNPHAVSHALDDHDRKDPKNCR